MSTYYSPKITTDNLVLCLDAGNKKSYPGSGTVWYDLANGNNFNIVAGAYNAGGYMDFNGSYGVAKNLADISLSDSTGITYFLVTRIKNSDVDWRTLTRSYIGDHHVIVFINSWNIGSFDNDVGGPCDTGYSIQNLPNYGTSNWISLHWRWSSTSPYYQMSYNDTPNIIRATSTDPNSRYNRGFGSIGGYHNGDTNPSNGSQFWGDIAYFAVYSKYLTNAEILQNHNSLKGRYAL